MKLSRCARNTVTGLWLLLSLGGCSALHSDSCADQGNLSTEQRKERGCDGGFFSASRLRGTTYQGDDSPRLWTGAPSRTEKNIDPSALNTPPSGRAPIVGYAGSLRMEVPVDPGAIVKDQSDIRLAGAPTFDPNEQVAVDFNGATVEFFLKQLLGGALRVNYFVPPNLGGAITFHTERPIAKSQVIMVVRDVLGRNGLEMTFMNGVYQIGSHEEIAAMRAAVAEGGHADQVSRIIRLQKGDANEIIAFVQQLVPGNVTLTAMAKGKGIVIRAAPTEIQKVSELISLAESGVGDDRVAIIPLHESSPEKLAAKLNEFYRSQLGENSRLTVMPLENQQSILVGTNDARVMEGLKKLVARLDRDTGSDYSLRIIPLTYLGAEEIVPQLSEVFATNGDGGAPTAEHEQGLYNDPAGASGGGGGNGGGRDSPNEDQNRDAVPERDRASPPQQSRGNRGENSERAEPRAVPGNGSGQAIRFVADKRNNAMMVYSSYSMFKRISQLIKTLDAPQAQVVIEATVAEVQLNDNLSRGVEAFLTSNNILNQFDLPLEGPPQLQVGSNRAEGGVVKGRFRVAGATVDVIMRALQDVTKVKVVSSPYLTVRDGKTAKLFIGDQVPFRRSSVSSSANGNSPPTVVDQIETKDTGVSLEITPRIRQDDSAVLTINQSVSNVNAQADKGNLTHTINTRSVNSEIIAKSGATILLAGMIKDFVSRQDTGVPILKDLAIVGNFFKQTDDKVSREELIVMITPRVIRNYEGTAWAPSRPVALWNLAPSGGAISCS